MKYKNKYDFAEKTINKVPFVQTMNIKVRVSQYSIGFTPLKGEVFNGGNEITMSFMDHLGGIIDGLIYAYEEIKPKKRK